MSSINLAHILCLFLLSNLGLCRLVQGLVKTRIVFLKEILDVAKAEPLQRPFQRRSRRDLEQEGHRRSIRVLTDVFGRKGVDHILYDYNHIFPGFAVSLTDSQVTVLKDHSQVISVEVDQVHEIRSAITTELLGLNRTRTGLWRKTNGTDVIIGVLDSGIWPEDVSFSDDGYGPVPPKWKGICQEGQNWTISNCNRKVVGARWFNRGYAQLTATDPDSPPSDCLEYRSPRDAVGHGSYTASIAAGSAVYGAMVGGFKAGSTRGVAFGARLAVYKVCWCNRNGPVWPNALCSSADIIAALDAAVADGVDVVSASIGGGPVPRGQGYSNPVAYASFYALLHGIPLVFAAGNRGSSGGWYTVENAAPWQFSVASSTTGSTFRNFVVLPDGRRFQGTALLNNGTRPSGRYFPLVLGGQAAIDPADQWGARLCNYNSLNPSLISGAVVLCERGGALSVDQKGQSVLDAGGLGMVLYNSEIFGEDLAPAVHYLPATVVGYSAGVQLLKYANSSRHPRVAITATVEASRSEVVEAPKMRPESSVGPSESCFSIIKPDITAPGGLILGAWSQNPKSEGASRTSWLPAGEPTQFSYEYGGTSVAAPHVAGVMALLKALNPTWPPSYLYSALTTTASTFTNRGRPIPSASLKPDGYAKPATPFHFGGGHIHPNRAADPGLVFGLSSNDYNVFLCSPDGGYGSVESLQQERNCPVGVTRAMDLNLPSVSFFNVTETTSTERVLTNVAKKGTYFVSVKVPRGSRMVVKPQKLVFGDAGDFHKFQIVLYPLKSTAAVDDHLETYPTQEEKVREETFAWTFGSITWSDWFGHRVKINVAVNVA